MVDRDREVGQPCPRVAHRVVRVDAPGVAAAREEPADDHDPSLQRRHRHLRARLLERRAGDPRCGDRRDGGQRRHRFRPEPAQELGVHALRRLVLDEMPGVLDPDHLRNVAVCEHAPQDLRPDELTIEEPILDAPQDQRRRDDTPGRACATVAAGARGGTPCGTSRSRPSLCPGARTPCDRRRAPRSAMRRGGSEPPTRARATTDAPSAAMRRSGHQGSWKKRMYHDFRSCDRVRRIASNSADAGGQLIATSLSTNAGACIAVAQATAPPQSCPTRTARSRPRAAIRPVTSRTRVPTSYGPRSSVSP